ncbi:MAG: cytidylate kinase family protein [Clostridia bacterium]|nr:cytidylate kinase family protein [Clostridia bacterium]
MNEKISLAGDLGSGKSTVSNILIKELDAEYYSTGAIVRSIAAKRGMSVVELNVYMETHPEIDTEIDEGVKALADVEKSLIIDSRMAWHFTKGTFKVYLSTDPETSALRIMNANRKGEHAATLEETILETKARRESEKKRYMTQYGVNIMDMTNYDLIVDTTAATPDEVATYIIGAFNEWKNDRNYRISYISSERLNFPDDAPDEAKIAEYSSMLDCGEVIGQVEIAERDGEFYVVGSPERAIAYVMNAEGLIPCKLVADMPENAKYVKMRNSL